MFAASPAARQVLIRPPESGMLPAMVHRVALLFLTVLACAAPAWGLGTRSRTGRPLDRMLDRYGFPRAVQQEDTIIAQSPYTRMVFTVGSRKLIFNGVLTMMNAPLTSVRRRPVLEDADVRWTIAPLLRPSPTLAAYRFRRIVLDPGHGGNDPGAEGPGGTREKDVTLHLARRTAERLKAARFSVRLTRTGDRYISLAGRANYAAQAGADLFLSIHLNAAANRNAAGLETYILPAAGYPSTSNSRFSRAPVPGNRHDAASMVLAYHVHDALLGRTGLADRGIRRARHKVLQDAPCPAILIECGFVSNPGEESRIGSERFQAAVAGGIAAGIQRLAAAAQPD